MIKLILALMWLAGFSTGLWAGAVLARRRLLKLIGTGRLLITSGYSADSLKRLYEQREKEWNETKKA